MGTIAKQNIMTTVRMIANKEDGQWTGTGFVYLHERNGKKRSFLVTNKHIVEGAITGEMIFHEGEIINGKIVAKLGCGLAVPFTQYNFWGHKDENVDIAVMNLSTIIELNLSNFYTMQITERNRPKPEDIEKFISPIDEVIFIGYPIGLWDEKNLLPIARKGITATPYYIDFNGEPKFLIDASVFPGSSGSPVFNHHSGMYVDNFGEIQTGERDFFIGIIAKYMWLTDEGDIIDKEIPSSKKTIAEYKQAINIGIVFNDKAVVETMDDFVDRILEPLEEQQKTIK